MFLVWLPFNSQGILLDGRGLPVNGGLWVGEVDKDPMSYPVALFVDNVPVVNPVVVVNGVVPTLFTDVGAVSLLLKDEWNREVWYLNKQLFGNIDIPLIGDPSEPPSSESPPPDSQPPSSPPVPVLPIRPANPNQKYYYTGMGVFFLDIGEPINVVTWEQYRKGELKFDSDDRVPEKNFALTLDELFSYVLHDGVIQSRARQIYNHYRTQLHKYKKEGWLYSPDMENISDTTDYEFGGVYFSLSLSGKHLETTISIEDADSFSYAFDVYGNPSRERRQGLRVQAKSISELISDPITVGQLNRIQEHVSDKLMNTALLDKSWQVGELIRYREFDPDSYKNKCLCDSNYFTKHLWQVTPYTQGKMGVINGVYVLLKGTGTLTYTYKGETITRYLGDTSVSGYRYRESNEIREFGTGFHSNIRFHYLDFSVEKTNPFEIWE